MASAQRNEVLRVGIAGCGLIAGAPLRGGRPLATNHAAACENTDRTELVAAADPLEERRERFRRQWDVPVFGSLREMLSQKEVDLLVVATPPETHEQLCLEAVELGVRALFCEKPLSGTHAGATRIIEAAERAQIPLAVNFTRRWDSSHAELLRRLKAGELGTLQAVLACYTGTIRGNGSHAIDTLQLLLREQATAMWTTRLLNATDGPVGATISFGSIPATLLPVVGAEYFVFEVHLLGTKGRARILMSGNDIRVDRPTPSEHYPGYSYLEEHDRLPADTLPGAFSNAIAALRDAVLANIPLPVAVRDHLVTLALIERLVEMAANSS